MDEKETLPLNEEFANALPDNTQFTFHHLSTPPTRCDALFSAPAKSSPDRTYRESHLLLASVDDENNPVETPHNHDHDAHSQQQQQQQQQQGQQHGKNQVVPVLAIEIIIYTTKHLTTLFVSKADSTGYLSILNLPVPTTTLAAAAATTAGQYSSPARSICTTFISHLVRNRRRPRTKLVVSLFARAQDQYLFPGSVENKTKHVLDDRGLVKWWCKVLDPVIRSNEGKKRINTAGHADAKDNSEDVLTKGMGRKEDGVDDTAAPVTDAGADTDADAVPPPPATGYLIVPGFDKYELTAFFPPTWRSDHPEQKRWKCGHPLHEISHIPDAPPRCLIPHFPDDPKARFLTELDDEIPSLTNNSNNNSQIDSSPSKEKKEKEKKLDQWRSVRTLDQFWEMMAFRQECSSGRLVGFIWAVFYPAKGEVDDSASPTRPILSPSKSKISEQSSINHSDNPSSCQQATDPSQPHKSKRRKELKGPIIPRQPRIKSSSSSSSSSLSSSSSISSSLSSSTTLSFSSSPSSKNATTINNDNRPEQTEYYYWPKRSRGQLILSEKDYSRATEMLLRLDFSSLDSALTSFARWTREISILARSTWGQRVIGKKKMKNIDLMKASASAVGNDGAKSSTALRDGNNNSIPTISAKREPLANNNASEDGDDDGGSGLKRKIEYQDSSHNQPINILGSGLVKKKQKKFTPTPVLQQ